MIPVSEVKCCDNVKFMKEFPDEFFDVAVVDPGYGIGEDWKKDSKGVHYKHNSSYKNDTVPSKEYFEELFRVSKNQIIWGGNYFTEFLRPVNSWIIWDKKRDVEKTFMSECEMAWTSFNVPARIFRFQWDGGKKENETGITKIHPHQKPLALYSWIFKRYGFPGCKILDTNMGSQSSRIAAYCGGFDYWGCEIDPEYFSSGCERFEKECKGIVRQIGGFVQQQKLFV
jgi:site-specific DNA-methyltransferase (adenine-specific)